MYSYVRSQADLDALAKMLHKANLIAFDIETTGLDALVDKVVLLSFTWRESSGATQAAVVRRYGLDITPLKSVLEGNRVLKVIHNAKFEYKMLLQQEGIDIHRMYCTYLGEKVLFTGKADGFGLDALVLRYTDKQMPKEQRKTFIGLAPDAEFTDEQLQYAADDTSALFQILENQLQALKDQNLVEIMQLEISLVPVLAKMELGGLDVDADKWRAYLASIYTKRNEIAPDVVKTLTARVKESYYRRFILFQGNYQQEVVAAAPEALAVYYGGPVQRKPKKDRAAFDEKWLPIIQGTRTIRTEEIGELPRTVMQAINRQLPKGTVEKVTDTFARLQELSDTGINLNSTQQLIEAYEQVGIRLGITGKPDWKYTMAKYQADDEALKAAKEYLKRMPQLSDIYRATEMLLQYREYEKQLSTFGDKMLEKRHPLTGKLHPEFRQYGAETGRMSATNPNVMQIPGRGDKRIFRTFFVAPQGNVIVKADFSQIEVRIAAHLSQDPTLIDAFKTGKDLHSYTASLITGVSYDEIEARRKTEKYYDDLRKNAKAVMFGLAYAMSEFGLAARTGMSLDQAKEFVKSFSERYPQLVATLDTLGKNAQRYGFAKSLAGRIRWFKLPPQDLEPAKRHVWLKDVYRQGRNFPIQASNADMTKQAGVWIAERIAQYDARPVNFVHDEIVVTCPSAHADTVAGIVKSAMLEAAAKWVTTVPVDAEVSVGHSWGG